MLGWVKATLMKLGCLVDRVDHTQATRSTESGDTKQSGKACQRRKGNALRPNKGDKDGWMEAAKRASKQQVVYLLCQNKLRKLFSHSQERESSGQQELGMQG